MRRFQRWDESGCPVLPPIGVWPRWIQDMRWRDAIAEDRGPDFGLGIPVDEAMIEAYGLAVASRVFACRLGQLTAACAGYAAAGLPPDPEWLSEMAELRRLLS